MSADGLLYRHCMTWRFAAGTCSSCKTNCPALEQRQACAKQQASDNREYSRRMHFFYAVDKVGAVHCVPNAGERNYTGCVKRFTRNHVGEIAGHPVLVEMRERGPVTCPACLVHLEGAKK